MKTIFPWINPSLISSVSHIFKQKLSLIRHSQNGWESAIITLNRHHYAIAQLRKKTNQKTFVFILQRTNLNKMFEIYFFYISMHTLSQTFSGGVVLNS